MTHNTHSYKRTPEQPVLRCALDMLSRKIDASKDRCSGKRLHKQLSFVVCLPLVCASVHANPVQSLATQNMAMSIIGGNALSEVRGAVSVNLTAGDGNAQGNHAAIAVAPAGTANTQTFTIQQTDDFTGTGVLDTAAEISDHAFARSIGLISINQASGTGNRQLNQIGIAMGIAGSSVNENVLAEASAGPSSLGESATTQAGKRSVSISETAFAQAAGVVQVNQAAGSGNTSTNSFALNLPVSAKF